MIPSSLPSFDKVEALVAKGRAERARALAELLAASAAKVVGGLKAVRSWAARRVEAARAARELRDMDPRMLADIGLSRAEVELAARGELKRASRPALDAANESVAPERRSSPRAA